MEVVVGRKSLNRIEISRSKGEVGKWAVGVGRVEQRKREGA